jgi:hypothetical protein
MTSSRIEKHLKAKRITPKDGHYFFGYFDKSPWDVEQRYLLAHRTGFMGKQPTKNDTATIGMVDLQNENKFVPLTETYAWCWQQGAMLQWLNNDPSGIIFNERRGNYFAAKILNIKTGAGKKICRPIYCQSPNGKYALSVNFSRLDKERPGYGYAGIPDQFDGELHPKDDGIWLVDLENNNAKLIVSYLKIAQMYPRENMDTGASWFNHLLFSPNSSRIAFLYRWRQPGGSHLTHMFTSNIEGNDIFPLNLDDMSSHYTWLDNIRIINYSRRFNQGDHYYLYYDQTQKVDIVGKEAFESDGHCSFSKDGRWMLTDSYSYPETGHRRFLYLYDNIKNIRYEIGAFYSDPDLPAPTRCDLHPRWSRDCKQICFDSIHEGSRHIYIMDLSIIVQ